MTKKFANGFLFNSVSRASTRDEGLRKYMLGIYNYMCIGLMLSGVIAFTAAKTGLAVKIFNSPLGIIVSLAPIGISLYLAARFHKMSFASTFKSFLLYAGVMGLSLSTIFIAFNYHDIALAFCISAGMFAGMSVYGYVTQRDLSSFGSIIMTAIWGILIASLVNIFFKSGTFSLLISFFSVILFTGMVAFDTQKLRRLYYISESCGLSSSKIAVFGAMQLYIDFVAIFINILQLLRGFDRDR